MQNCRRDETDRLNEQPPIVVMEKKGKASEESKEGGDGIVK